MKLCSSDNHHTTACTCNRKCNGTTIKCSTEKKVLGVTIDDKLTFTSRLGNIIKKANQKLHALNRLKLYYIRLHGL